jgi:hypothetical protein
MLGDEAFGQLQSIARIVLQSDGRSNFRLGFCGSTRSE